MIHPDPIKSVVLVDETCRLRATRGVGRVCHGEGRVASPEKSFGSRTVAIDLKVDHQSMVGSLNAGDIAEIETRQLTHHDHLCANEVIYYPPLSEVVDYKPAVTVSGRYGGRGLGNALVDSGKRAAHSWRRLAVDLRGSSVDLRKHPIAGHVARSAGRGSCSLRR